MTKDADIAPPPPPPDAASVTAATEALLAALARALDCLAADEAAANAAAQAAGNLESQLCLGAAATASPDEAAAPPAAARMCAMEAELTAAMEARLTAELECRALTERVQALDDRCRQLADLRERLVAQCEQDDADSPGEAAALEARVAMYADRLGLDVRSLREDRVQVVIYLEDGPFSLVLRRAAEAERSAFELESCNLGDFAAERLPRSLAALREGGSGAWPSFLAGLRSELVAFLR